MEPKDIFHVLIIDDNPEIHKDFIKMLLPNEPERKEFDKLSDQIFDEKTVHISLPEFDIDTASQGEEGIQLVSAGKKENYPYALAFVDIRMPPGIDGIETIKRMWKIDPDIQVVIFSAYSDYTWEEIVEKLGQKESLFVLKKPFDYIAVRQIVLALIKKWELLKKERAHKAELEGKVKERTKSLEQFLSISRSTLESSMDGIFVLSEDYEILDYNKKLIEMWGVPDSILAKRDGKCLMEYISTKMEDPKKFMAATNKLISSTKKTDFDNVKSSDHDTIELYSQPYNLKDNVAGRIWSFRDISKRTKLEATVRFQATHDILTKLPNRKYLMDFIESSINESNRSMSKFAILFLDIDHFKRINDTYSHEVGDKVLVQFSSRIKHYLRRSDVFARMGGDEFVLVVKDYQSTIALKNIADKLLKVIKPDFELEHQTIHVSSSIGISIYPYDGKTVADLLSNADKAMYRAKELGGGQAQYYTAELNNESIKRLEMEVELRNGIKNNEFFLCYQPLYDLLEKKLVSVEVLIRWRHPTKGLIYPVNFIPLAEEMGVFVELGRWITKEACRQNKIWQEMGLPPIRVSVNMTSHQFEDPEFVPLIKTALEEVDLDPKYLEIELTENTIANNVESINKLRRLRNLGVSIAIDDFGTGYTSLTYLKEFPLDCIKIDRSFIKDIDTNSTNRVIVEAIMSIAKNLKIEVVACGVETKEQMEYLMKSDCDDAQGFYFSKPVEADEIEKLLKKVPDK